MNVRALGVFVSAVVLYAILGNGLGMRGVPAFDSPPAPTFSFRGAGSCSATACHGDSQPSGAKILRNEHTTWIKRDRHADAFSVLLEERSRSIAANLSGGSIPAEKDRRCLACHETRQPEPAALQSQALQREGVGCESCHGPADRWIGVHTRWDWSNRSPEDKERFGMIETGDLSRRAKLCAGCHIGELARDGRPAREVDHEMIAAGHPRLNFEFAAYQATMTHHWRDDIGPDSSADFPARAWTIGQLVSAKAAVDLLGDRARRANPATNSDRSRQAEWPELSEYACYSCHHDLRDETWRRRQDDRGTARWGEWHFAMPGSLTAFGTAAEFQSLSEGLIEIRRLMGEQRPDPAEAARAATRMSGDLELRLKAIPRRGFKADEVEKLLSSVGTSSLLGKMESWEQATQQYLALVPLNQALRSLAPGRSDPKMTGELKRLRDSLRFPAGFDSPNSFDPAQTDRPR